MRIMGLVAKRLSFQSAPVDNVDCQLNETLRGELRRERSAHKEWFKCMDHMTPIIYRL